MRQLSAFLRKEGMEFIRTGKIWILLIIFILFGIMNPAIAKLTPWMVETMSDSLAESGMVLTEVKVNAMTSWNQFYNNISMALIIFALMLSGILTTEYQKGTLVNMLTKGLVRWKVVGAKAIASIGLWTVCYWLCYGITYGYNMYFWDNSIASHVAFAALCVYLLGIWVMLLILLISTLLKSASGVLAVTGVAVIASYVAGMFGKIGEYLPIRLLSAGNLLAGSMSPEDFWKAIAVALASGVAFFILSVACFNRKNIG